MITQLHSTFHPQHLNSELFNILDCCTHNVTFLLLALLTGILENLTEARNSLEELWEKRKVKLDLSLELRYLEYEYEQVSVKQRASY